MGILCLSDQGILEVSVLSFKEINYSFNKTIILNGGLVHIYDV